VAGRSPGQANPLVQAHIIWRASGQSALACIGGSATAFSPFTRFIRPVNGMQITKRPNIALDRPHFHLIHLAVLRGPSAWRKIAHMAIVDVEQRADHAVAVRREIVIFQSAVEIEGWLNPKKKPPLVLAGFTPLMDNRPMSGFNS